MVLCYKIITDSPQPSGSVSPRKTTSPQAQAKLPELIKPIAQLFTKPDENASSLIDDIPEREWRLLAVLARKRDQEQERQRLAEQCRRLWEKEKEEKDLISSEISQQYRLYLTKKREHQNLVQYLKSYQRQSEDMMRQELLENCIRQKEKRSECVFSWAQGQKANELLERALEEEAKLLLAADRRSRRLATDQLKKELELEHRLMKMDKAARKKEAMIRDASQRAAIANRLSHWESTLLRQEVQVREEYRRLQHAAHAELTNQRAARLACAKERRQNRARRVAAFTQQLRDCVRLNIV